MRTPQGDCVPAKAPRERIDLSYAPAKRTRAENLSSATAPPRLSLPATSAQVTGCDQAPQLEMRESNAACAASSSSALSLPGPAEPWDWYQDAVRFDVFSNADRLDSECLNSAVESHGPNCGTFSRARERPIPGVARLPPPLRSINKPRGLDHISAQPHFF